MQFNFPQQKFYSPLCYNVTLNVAISENSHAIIYSPYRTSMTKRSLEIHIQIIFNDLIKQNQKLYSDSVLKQSTAASSVQSPASKV